MVQGRGREPEDDGFRRAFDRVMPLATRVAFRLTGDRGLSEDIAAEALTRLYVSWWRLSSMSHQDAWVLRVTTNLAIDALRRRRRSLPAARAEAALVDDDVVLRLALADALRRLPSRQLPRCFLSVTCAAPLRYGPHDPPAAVSNGWRTDEYRVTFASPGDYVISVQVRSVSCGVGDSHATLTLQVHVT